IVGTYDLESFHYEGARRDLQGRGFLGFAYRSWIDDRDGTAQRRSYKQDFPFIGFVTNARRTQEPSGTVISEVAAVPAAHSYGSGTEARSLPFTSTVTRTEREVGGPYNGNLVRTIVQNNSVDSATGVTYDTTVTVSEPTSGSANGVQAGASYVQRTYQPTASFLNDWTNWCFGRPQEVQQINSHNQVGGGAITRTSSITWDALKCRPTQTKAEPGHAQLQVNRDLGYDNFGNFNSDRTTGIGVTEERTTTAEWDTMGRFPLSVTQRVSPTVSHATHFGWDTDKGLLTSSTDPNNVETGYVYDAFGRLIGERSTGRHEARPHIQFLSSS
ncbi:MAG: RHS repeat domain-containing protein, partial [Steroidobacteraceae bacterium]